MIAVSILPALTIYMILAGFLDEQNIFSYLDERYSKQYVNFYSGRSEGFYHSIGHVLDSNLSSFKPENNIDGSSDIDLKLRVHNEPTSGSTQNIFKVLSDNNSFGLVQEEHVRNKVILTERIEVVSPLYMERLHILYRKDKFFEVFKESQGPPERSLILSTNSSNQALRFIKNSRIGTGPIGSGTREVVNYLLDELAEQYQRENQNKSFISYSNIEYLSFDEGLKKLSSGDSIQILFAMIGAPMSSASRLLDTNKNIGMAHVTPSLIRNISETSGNFYRITNFNNKYDFGEERISTIGSYCYLIANKNVSQVKTEKILRLLDLEYLKDQLKSEGNIDSTVQFQLNEVDFLSIYETLHRQDFWELTKNAGLFIFSFIVSWVAFVNFFLYLISEYKQIRFFKRINSISTQALVGTFEQKTRKGYNSKNSKFNLELVESETHKGIIVPKENDTSSEESLREIIKAINGLFMVSNDLHLDYSTGGVIDAHHKYLSELINKSRESLRKKLVQHLNEMLESGYSISRDILTKYYSGGFLSADGYQFLMNKLSIDTKS